MHNSISIAVDFDGTMVEDKFPEIGEPKEEILQLVKELKNMGVKMILWTCRQNDKDRSYLTEAVEWCKNHGIVFDAVNENLPEVQARWGGDTRKVWVDYYLDDKSLGCKSVHKHLQDFVSYLKLLKCKKAEE